MMMKGLALGMQRGKLKGSGLRAIEGGFKNMMVKRSEIHRVKKKKSRNGKIVGKESGWFI